MKQKILFVLCLLSGLMFINAGLNKFFNYLPAPENLPEKLMKMSNAFMEIGWLMPLVGFAEVLGGILLIIPRTRALAAVVLFPVMLGIIMTNLSADPSGLIMSLVLLAIMLWALFEDKNKVLPLVMAK